MITSQLVLRNVVTEGVIVEMNGKEVIKPPNNSMDLTLFFSELLEVIEFLHVVSLRTCSKII